MTLNAQLEQHATTIKNMHMRDMFAEDPKRFDKFHATFASFLLDYSKNNITDETMTLLFRLAESCNMTDAVRAMFSGEKINTTENRAVLHTALRNRDNHPIYVDGVDVMPQINMVLAQMKDFSDAVRSGDWHGATNQEITDVVNIGIGGSHLGPDMAVTALAHYKTDRLNFHFVSNVDGTDITETLKKCHPENTLFVVASKTFTTQETLMNAETAKKWLINALGVDATAKHFVALSTNTDAVTEFGILPQNMFPFWDWVGGRYSLWSAIGLSVMLAIGYDGFIDMLTGAYEMDQHFLNTPLEQNLPVIMGLLGIWHTDYMGSECCAILPYDQYLRKMPAYLQQLDMESNGKLVHKDGSFVKVPTGPVLFGEPGTNGQHSFYQLLHQGNHIIPADFIAPIHSLNDAGEHHVALLANFVAQPEALMRGQSRDDLRGMGVSEDMIPFKYFPGNRPTNTILFDRLTPKTFGSLIALYEHKVFVQGVIWNINSFDQMGVELGKRLAKNIIPELSNKKQTLAHDCSTNAIIQKIRENR